MKNSVFIPDVPTHDYQKGFDGNVLFYCLRDRLVYFTIFCMESRRWEVTVLALDLMFTHTHSLIRTASSLNHTRFNQTVQMKYAREFNDRAHRSGPVFMKTYGWAQKKSNAKVRSCLSYIANNQVEKKLCRRGVDERWTFLAYAFSDHPFSEPLVIRRASARMKKAVRQVRDAHRRGQFLNYTFLDRVYAGLDAKERAQLTDFIIRTYLVIDFEQAGKYFGSIEKMIQAFDVTTGSEYEISEAYEPEPDTAYIEILRHLEKVGYDLTSKPFLSIPEAEKHSLAKQLTRRTSASYRQAARVLHLPPLPSRSETSKRADSFFQPPFPPGSLEDGEDKAFENPQWPFFSSH